MSDSDQKRRDYLWSTMNMGERSSELRRMLLDVQRRLDEIDNPGRTHFVGDDCAGGHRASPTECGRIVVDEGEWDRLRRIEEAAREAVDAWDAGRLFEEKFGLMQRSPKMGELREALKP